MERPWEYAGKTGITATLVGVQVLELEEYEGSSGGDEFTYAERPTNTITETADTSDDDENIPF